MDSEWAESQILENSRAIQNGNSILFIFGLIDFDPYYGEKNNLNKCSYENSRGYKPRD